MIERTNESLSALMDGEADELEIRRLLNQSSEQEELLETWHNYQLIGSLLREEPAFNLDLAKGVRQALDGEPMDDIAATPHSNQATAVASPVVQSNKWRWLVTSGAVAASVTMAVLVGVQWQQTGEQTMQVAQTTETQSEVVNVAAAPIELSAEQQMQLKEAQLKLQEYVLQHNDDTSTSSAARVMLPHARTVNFNQGVEKR